MLHARPTSDARNEPKIAHGAPRRHVRRARPQRNCAHLTRVHFAAHPAQPRYPVKALFDARQIMSGLSMGSEKRSHNVLPKSKEWVSNERRLRVCVRYRVSV